MSGKHTPGPWKLKRDGVIAAADGGLVATTGYRVTAVDDQDAPNARLIAAAPDLYDALERIERGGEHPECREIHTGPDCHCDQLIARDALAKVRATADG